MVETKDSSSLEDRLKRKMREQEAPVSFSKIAHAVTDHLDTCIGKIPVLATELKLADQIGNAGVRLGFGRHRYLVPTGIYGIGSPDQESPVLVTANYKLTLDALREELSGLDLWILVIDTKGVNVWCSAGKGTFSTEEIILRIRKCRLRELVSNDRLILPQLCAPGVSAFEIRNHTGFHAVYGPVYAADIREFLNNGFRATEGMRRVRFNLWDRLAVSWLEAVKSLSMIPLFFFFFFVLNYFGTIDQAISGGAGAGTLLPARDGTEISLLQAAASGLRNTMAYVIAILTGTILFPMLLPVLPFRMFSMKAAVLGLLFGGVVAGFPGAFGFNHSLLTGIGNLLTIAAIISLWALNFTGSTTFTSYSGVKMEFRRMVPIIVSAAILGIGLLIVGFLL